MFIAHGEKFRKNARWIMAAVLILLIPGFVALFTTTGGGNRKRTNLPKIRGKEVNATEFDQARNEIETEYEIRSGRSLPHSAAVEDGLTQQAVVRMLMMRKAKEMGLRVSQEELQRYIMTQPVFINEAQQFDPNRYQQFLTSRRQLGVTEALFWDVMRQQLLMERVQEIVSAAAKATPEEINLAYTNLHERAMIEVVQFDVADWKSAINISDSDAQAYFEKNKESFRQSKQAKVRYVLFSLKAAEKNVKLTDDEVAQYYERNRAKFEDADGKVKPFEAVKEDVRKDLLVVRADREAGDQATDFSARVAQQETAGGTNFTKSAAAMNLLVQETDFFGPMDEIKGIKDAQAFQRAAFALTMDAPYSDPVQGEDGYYVLQLVGSKPSEIPSFEKVKEKVIARLKQEKIYEATVKHGEEVLDKVKQAKTNGKSFETACKDLQLTVKTFGPVSIADEKTELPAGGRLKEMALGMAKGTVSDFVKTATGGLFFCLKDRLPPDPNADSLQREQLARMILGQNRQAIFQNWVNTLVQQEQVDFGIQRSPTTAPIRPSETEAESSQNL